MKVLFVNPIIYTPENAHIPQIDSIDDTMSYDLCMAFQRHGVDITLAAAEEWKPRKERDFPFSDSMDEKLVEAGLSNSSNTGQLGFDHLSAYASFRHGHHQ